MRARQPPTMLGVRVFTNLKDKSDEKPDEPTFHRIHTPHIAQRLMQLLSKWKATKLTW